MQILLVDHEQQSRSNTTAYLRDLGHSVVTVADGNKALEQYYNNPFFHIVMIELAIPDMTGLELLSRIKNSEGAYSPDIVLLSSSNNADFVIQAMRKGAYDFLIKPLNQQKLKNMISRCAQHQGLLKSCPQNNPEYTQTSTVISEFPKNKYLSVEGFGPVFLHSPVMHEIYEQAHILHSDRSVPVLIQGETGTGKELIARYIHFANHKSNRPFVAINCSNLSPNLLESELFGYEAGSFTGAFSSGKNGKIDLARGGTLLFDEISELSLKSQAKLLRVLQEKEFYRLGGLKTIQSDIRIICATNQNLDELVERKKFRMDLFYRLNIASITLPPLRDRKEDIVPLARIFMQEFSVQRGKNYQSISPRAARFLREYTWPGNIRQLRSVIDIYTLLHNHTELKLERLETIMASQHPPHNNTHYTQSSDWSNFSLPSDRLPLLDLNKQVIIRALKKHQGNISKTARYLDISPRSLSYRIKKWDIPKFSNDR